MWPGMRPTSIPSGILIHPAVWPQYSWAKKWGLLCPFRGGAAAGVAGFPSNTMWPGPKPTSIPNGILIHPAVWPQYMRRKVGELLCPFLGEAGSPYNTMWPGPRPTSTPSFILIHPTVWPQYTNVTSRTDRQGNGPISQGQPFYKRSPKK